MNEPAMAKDDTSMPKIPSRGLPIKRKAKKITDAAIEALAGSISPVFDLISRITGIDPGMSIIANRTIKAARISTISKCIHLDLEQMYGEKMNSPFTRAAKGELYHKEDLFSTF
jgi:hypothetical protein